MSDENYLKVIQRRFGAKGVDRHNQSASPTQKTDSKRALLDLSILHETREEHNEEGSPHKKNSLPKRNEQVE